MPGIPLADRSMFVSCFFSEETDWRSGLYNYSQKNSHNFPCLPKNIQSVICSVKEARVKTLNMNIQTLAACSGWLLWDNRGILSGLS